MESEMELTLHTEFVFDSAHHLVNYRGKCSNLHGHTWRVEVWFRGGSQLKDKVGILVDFGIVQEIKEVLDHNCLNAVLPRTTNPTAENLTEFIYTYLKEALEKEHKEGIDVKVRVYETSIGKETYCEGGDF